MSNENLPEVSTVTAISKVDNGKPALFNPAVFDQVWRAAKLFSSSDLVPATYKGKPENCFIAIEMAERMGVNPFAVMQNLAIIQGRPAMEAKLIIALVNDSGLFVDPLEYEVVGDDAFAQDYKVRAFAVMKKTGKVCYGPWVDYRMVKGEGWLDKGGSKWKTMPSIMFMYRAASFFAKVYAPNITMGMQTREEMEDTIPPAVQHIRNSPIDDLNAAAAQIEHNEQSSVPATRERGKPSPGKQRRTAAEVEEDRLADEADARTTEHTATEPATTEQTTAAAVVDAVAETVDQTTGEVMGGEPLPNVDTEDDNWPDPPNGPAPTGPQEDLF